jgi:Protein of unknown function (DUF1573)
MHGVLPDEKSRIALEEFRDKIRRMKLPILSVILFFVPALLHAELKWEQTSQQLTYEKGAKNLRMEFSYTNSGKTPVKITDVKGGCACCTSAHATLKELAPGDSGKVIVRVDPGGKQLPMTKSIVVTTDDGKNAVLLVQVVTADGQPLTVPRWEGISIGKK